MDYYGIPRMADAIGPIEALGTSMEYIKQTLLKEGFSDPSPLQVWKEGQVFGLTKPVGRGLEMHVRGYNDSSLDSEIELSRDYLEHPYDCRPFYGPLLELLVRNGIPYITRRPLPPDPNTIAVPPQPTPWKPLVAAGLATLAGLALAWYLNNDEE